MTVTNNVPSVTITCNEGYSKTGTTDRTHSFTVTGSAGATSLSGSCSAQCNVVAIDPNGGVSGSITTLYKKTGSGTWYTNNTCTTSYSTTKNVLPTRSGYTLRGLYDTKYADVDSDNNVGQRLIALSGNSGTLGNAWKITEDTSLYAAWAKNCVTPNNGTCSLTIKDYGYTDYTTTCNDGYSISGNNTATPSCTGNKITLKFANGGHGTAPTSPASCTYGSTFTMPSAMSATGYTFNKWSVNGNTFGAGQTNVTCNYTNLGVYSGTATITGTWNLIEYTITYNLNGGTNSSSNPSSYTIETATITLANPTKNGYTFAGWYDASTGGNKVTQIAKGSTGNKTFYARWNNCGAGYWCANGGKTACSSGLTTIGYGAGADEAGDCGRVLYVGGQKLYLRSTEKTDVSLHVKVGGTTFYGNMVVGSKKMSAGATKTLKIKHKGQVYSVYDDSAN